MKLQEIIETKIEIVSEKKTTDGEVMNVLVPVIKSDIKNRNGRIYKKSLLQREFAKVQNSIKKGSFIGTGDHPQSGIADIATASHIITALALDEKGQGWAEMRILPTERGKTIQTLVRNNAQLGVSLRGFGDISKNGEVSDNYSLVGIDIVCNPSDPTAHFDLSNVYESQNFQENLDAERRKDLEAAVNDLMTESYLSAIESGMWKGTQAEYEKKFGQKLRERYGIINQDLALIAEEKEFTDEQKIARIQSFYQEAVDGGFRGTIDEFKEKFPSIISEARQEDTPLKIIREEASEDYQKLISAYQESVQAGFKGNFESWKDEHPEIIESLVEPKPEKKDPLEEEAERIFKKLKEENPESSLQLESVKEMLLKEQEPYRKRKTRELAIYRVNKSLSGSGDISQELLEKMIQQEEEAIREERELRKKKNWEAYKRLLD